MAEVVTYKNNASRGVYSQLKLSNNDKVFISIAMRGVTISKLNFLNFPSTTIWRSANIDDAMQKFMGDVHANPFGLLDAAIRYITNCNSLDEVSAVLNKNS